jgi:hypothetical protein
MGTRGSFPGGKNNFPTWKQKFQAGVSMYFHRMLKRRGEMFGVAVVLLMYLH